MAYVRAFAVNYARYYWNRVCHDGRVATRSGYPREINKVSLSPGLAFSDIGTIDGEEDCTHFLSCCVGNGLGVIQADTRYGTVPVPMFPGGGLHMPSPFAFAAVYGETYTPRIVPVLKRLGATVVGPEFQVKQYDTTAQAVNKLQPGDVVAYAEQPKPSTYAHICLIVAPGGKIACHTTARFGKNYDDVYHPWVTLLKMP
jgi:hypothetical protein